MSEAKVLEFQSLATRPFIRPADARELPRDFSTRVSLKIADRGHVFGPYEVGIIRDESISFESGLLQLIVMLDVQVEYLNRIDGTSFVHTPNVYEVDVAVFLDELLPDLTKKARNAVKSAHAALMRPLEGVDGSKYGRAALLMLERRELEAFEMELGRFSVGGFVYRGEREPKAPYVGVMEGDTDEAARRVAYSAVPAGVIGRWATGQARLIDQNKFLKSQLLRASQRIITAGGDPSSLPYCFVEGSLVDYVTAKQAMKTNSQVLVPLSEGYPTFELYGYSDMTEIYFNHRMKKEVFILASDRISLIDEDIFHNIKRNGLREISLSDLKLRNGQPLSLFLDTLRELWSCEPRLTIEEEQLLQADLHSLPPLRWVLDLRRPS